MLELQNIGKRYGKKTALSNINIRFESGIYGLLGPNGAGKSTMMNILADVLEPTEGKVLYDGTDIRALKDQYRLHIGYLPQKVGYYDDFTAEKTLEYFAVLRGVAKEQIRERTAEALKAVNLTENAKDKVKTFSGGMKQRLGIAVTLAADPKILILDEPTVGLDPKERKHFRGLIKGLAGEKTILLSTHIVSDIDDIADYVILLKEGKMIGAERIADAGRLVGNGENGVMSLEDVYMHYFGEGGGEC